MAKRVVQHATSASRRTKRVAKPTTPWRRKLRTDVPEEIIKANPGLHMKFARKGDASPTSPGTRVQELKNNHYVEPKIPKDMVNDPYGGYSVKDCKLLGLPREWKEARDYYVQERAEQHLVDAERKRADKAKSKGFKVIEDSVTDD